MPTVVNATDVPSQVSQAAQGLTRGQMAGPFDWSPLLGIPAWFLILCFFVIVLITVNLYWLFRMKRLASVRGYVDAVKKSTQEDVMAWIISTTRNLSIECLRKRDAAISFYDKAKASWWIHNSPISVIHIGGKGGIFLSEDYYRSRDMVSEMAIVKACDEYNAGLNGKYKDLQFKGKPIGPISSYDDYLKFGRLVLEYLHPNGLEMEVYKIFNPEAFRKYFPKGMTAMANGAILIREARKLKVTTKPKSFWEKYLPLGMFMTVGLIVIIAAWMVPI